MLSYVLANEQLVFLIEGHKLSDVNDTILFMLLLLDGAAISICLIAILAIKRIKDMWLSVSNPEHDTGLHCTALDIPAAITPVPVTILFRFGR